MTNFQNEESKAVAFYKAHKTPCLIAGAVLLLIAFAALFGFRT